MGYQPCKAAFCYYKALLVLGIERSEYFVKVLFYIRKIRVAYRQIYEFSLFLKITVYGAILLGIGYLIRDTVKPLTKGVEICRNRL